MRKRKTVPKKCIGIKTDGAPCSVAALPASDFCFFHDPTKADERQEAKAMGGRANQIKTLGTDEPEIKVGDCSSIVDLLSETINQVRKGEIDPRIANAVGYLASVLIKALEQGDLEKRLEEIEEIVKKQRPSTELAIFEGGNL